MCMCVTGTTPNLVKRFRPCNQANIRYIQIHDTLCCTNTEAQVVSPFKGYSI